jgi:hypothetical protein
MTRTTEEEERKNHPPSFLSLLHPSSHQPTNEPTSYLQVSSSRPTICHLTSTLLLQKNIITKCNFIRPVSLTSPFPFQFPFSGSILMKSDPSDVIRQRPTVYQLQILLLWSLAGNPLALVYDVDRQCALFQSLDNHSDLMERIEPKERDLVHLAVLFQVPIIIFTRGDENGCEFSTDVPKYQHTRANKSSKRRTAPK